MAETPKHPQPDPPPASSVAEEKKPSPTDPPPGNDLAPGEQIPPPVTPVTPVTTVTTHHSPAPWHLHPHVHELDQFPTCFEVRGIDEGMIAVLVYNEADGITALELADAALITAAPRLLAVLRNLSDSYTRHKPGSIEWICAWDTADELLRDLKKAGVL